MKKEKFEKKLHNLHTATGNLNHKLWISKYNGLSIIADLPEKSFRICIVLKLYVTQFIEYNDSLYTLFNSNKLCYWIIQPQHSSFNFHH